MSPGRLFSRGRRHSRRNGLFTKYTGGGNHVDEGGADLVPASGFQAAIGVDPELVAGDPLPRPGEEVTHLSHRRAAGRVDVVDAGSDLIGVAIGPERIEQLHSGPSSLDRDHIRIQAADGMDDVVELRVAHMGVDLRGIVDA